MYIYIHIYIYTYIYSNDDVLIHLVGWQGARGSSRGSSRWCGARSPFRTSLRREPKRGFGLSRFTAMQFENDPLLPEIGPRRLHHLITQPSLVDQIVNSAARISARGARFFAGQFALLRGAQPGPYLVTK